MSDANPSSSSDDLQRDYYAPAVNPPYEAPRPRTPSIDLSDGRYLHEGTQEVLAWLFDSPTWWSIIFRIAGAGALFPLVILGGYALFGILVTFGLALPAILLGAIPIGAAAAGTGCVYAFLVAAPVALVVRISSWILDLTPRWEHAGAVTGGLTALVCLSPMVVSLVQNEAASLFVDGEDLLLSMLMAVVGTSLGMVAGALGGIENFAREQGTPSPELDTHRAAFHFSVRQILGAMLLVSLMLTALSILRVLTPAVLVLFGAWLAVILLGRGLAIRTALWWRERRLRKATDTNPASSST